MQINQVTAKFSVSGQIAPSDMQDIKNQGFNTIICNRPDNEELNQPTLNEISAIADEHNITVVNIPIIMKYTAQDILLFQKALNSHATPILAYCKSGTRSIILWALANKGNMSDEELIKRTKAAGYNVAHFIS